MMSRKTKVRKYSACAGYPPKFRLEVFLVERFSFLNPNFPLGLRLTWRYSIIHRKSGGGAIYFYEITESCDYFNIPQLQVKFSRVFPLSHISLAGRPRPKTSIVEADNQSVLGPHW